MVASPSSGSAAREPRNFDARRAFERVEQRVEESRPRGGVRVSHGGQLEVCRDHGRRRKAAIDIQDVDEAGHEEPSDNQEHRREGHFAADQPCADGHPAAAGGGRVRARLQHAGWIDARGAPCRHQSTEQRAGRSDGRGKHQRRRVELHFSQARDRDRCTGENGTQGDRRHRVAQRAAGEGEHGAFDCDERGQAPPSRSHRRADGQLALTSRPPRPKEAGDVYADDEQRRRDRAEHQPERTPGVGRNQLGERSDDGVGMNRCLGEFRSRDRRQLGLGGGHRHVTREPENDQIVGLPPRAAQVL